MPAFPPTISSIKGFPRKFPISEDVPKPAWATVTSVEQLGETVSQQITEVYQVIEAVPTQHNALLNIGINDHHNKLHAELHAGNGSDALKLPFEFKKDGVTMVKIDKSGNLIIKGRYLKG